MSYSLVPEIAKDREGFLQDYTLTGRTGVFPGYQSFLGIVHTMMSQYSKFNKMSREIKWRKDISSINYIEISTWTRQEHTGFSHQNPSFIGAVLNLKPNAARVYLFRPEHIFVDFCSLSSLQELRQSDRGFDIAAARLVKSFGSRYTL